jgi:hypothetical protein
VKTLRAFWHWIDNDKPTEIRRDQLSEVALAALLHAESEVIARAGVDYTGLWLMCSTGDGSAEDRSRPEFFRPELVAAVRELSLAICPALEAMHAAVGAAVPAPVELDSTFMTKARTNEYELRAERRPWFALSWVRPEAEPIMLPPGQYEQLRQELESDGFHVLTITAESCRTREACDRLRGLAPDKIILQGPVVAWVGCPVGYLCTDILDPMVTPEHVRVECRGGMTMAEFQSLALRDA